MKQYIIPLTVINETTISVALLDSSMKRDVGTEGDHGDAKRRNFYEDDREENHTFYHPYGTTITGTFG